MFQRVEYVSMAICFEQKIESSTLLLYLLFCKSMVSICIFSGISSTNNKNGIENKFKNFSLALKSKNLEWILNWSFKSDNDGL